VKDWYKFIISIITAGSGIGGSWYKMENRVTKLEQQLAEQERIKVVEMEILQMKRDEELAELKHRIKIDSLKNSFKKY
jgi:hexokinase